ncbi:MAG: YbaK/EbsC family protein [Anaerolineales bacterium]
MVVSTPVTDELTAKNIPYKVFQHPGPIRSLEQAAQERDQNPEQVVRSIMFRLSQGEYIMVLIAGPGRIAWSALRKYLGRSRLTMATEEEVLRISGYQLGAVSPFGLPEPMRILVDKSLLEQKEVSIGSGKRGLAVILDSTDMLRALDRAEIGAFGEG